MKIKKNLILIFLILVSPLYANVGEAVIQTLDMFYIAFIETPLLFVNTILSTSFYDLVKLDKSQIDSVEIAVLTVGLTLTFIFLILNLYETFLMEKNSSFWEFMKTILITIYKYLFVSLLILNSEEITSFLYGLISPVLETILNSLEISFGFDDIKPLIESQEVHYIVQIFLTVFVICIYMIFAYAILKLTVNIFKEFMIRFIMELVLIPIFTSLLLRKKYSDTGISMIMKYLESYIHMIKALLFLSLLANFPRFMTSFIQSIFNLPSATAQYILPTISSILGAIFILFAQNVNNKINIGLGKYLTKKDQEKERMEIKEAEKKQDDYIRKNIDTISRARGEESLSDKELNSFININKTLVTKPFYKKTFEKSFFGKKINEDKNKIRKLTHKKDELNQKGQKLLTDLKKLIEEQKKINSESPDIQVKNISSLTKKHIKEFIQDKEMNRNITKGFNSMYKEKSLLKEIKKGNSTFKEFSLSKTKKVVESSEKDINKQTNIVKKLIKFDIDIDNQINKSNNSLSKQKKKADYLNNEMNRINNQNIPVNEKTKQIIELKSQLQVLEKEIKLKESQILELQKQKDSNKNEIKKEKEVLEAKQKIHDSVKRKFQNLKEFGDILQKEAKLLDKANSLLDEIEKDKIKIFDFDTLI